MADMEKTTLYLPVDLAIRLRQTSRITGRSQAELIREALHLFLEQQGKPPLRSLGIFRSKQLTGRASEEWLRDNWHPE